MQSGYQRAEFAFLGILKFVSENDERGIRFGRCIGDQVDHVGQIGIEIAAIGNSRRRCRHRSAKITKTEVEGAGEIAKPAPCLFGRGARRLATIEAEQCRPDLRHQH